MVRLTAPTYSPMLELLLAQSRVLQAVACGTTLEGTPAELMQQLRIGPQTFRPALHDLVEGGWVFATTAHDGRLTVGRERRRRHAGPPDPGRAPAGGLALGRRRRARRLVPRRSDAQSFPRNAISAALTSSRPLLLRPVTAPRSSIRGSRFGMNVFSPESRSFARER